MEDIQNTQSEAQVTPPQSTAFSIEPKSKNNGLKWILIFVGLLIIGGAGIFFFTKSDNEPIATSTPSFNVTPIEDKVTPQPTKTSEPAKKSDVSIEIKNGTGITGEAALLQTKLKELGFTDIKVGNADSTNNTITTVTFLKSLSQATQDELIKELDKFYKEVSVKTSTTQKTDVVIVTGLRTSQTAKPTSSSTPRTSSSPTPSLSPTPTGTGN